MFELYEYVRNLAISCLEIKPRKICEATSSYIDPGKELTWVYNYTTILHNSRKRHLNLSMLFVYTNHGEPQSLGEMRLIFALKKFAHHEVPTRQAVVTEFLFQITVPSPTAVSHRDLSQGVSHYGKVGKLKESWR